MSCPACSERIPRTGRFCSSCGDEFPTLDSTATTETALTRSKKSSPISSPSSRGRFAPGRILGGRYRIVERVGKGGMGEVYNAEDLTLDHPVALKLLPEGLGQKERARETLILGSRQ